MKMAYEKRKSMYGYCFIALWFIGALIFFLIPVVESLFYSFREVSPDTGGMVGPFVGLDNYNYAFNVDPNYRQYLVKVLKDTAWKTPLILVFSLFVAVILNQKFKGRTFSRASLPPVRCTTSSTATCKAPATAMPASFPPCSPLTCWVS